MHSATRDRQRAATTSGFSIQTRRLQRALGSAADTTTFDQMSSSETQPSPFDRGQLHGGSTPLASTKQKPSGRFIDYQGTQEMEHVFSVQYSPNCQLLAAACNDGTVRVFSTKSTQVAYRLNVGINAGMPMTCVRFRPGSRSGGTQNVLIASAADGSIQHFHATSQQSLHRLIEKNNQVYALDYRLDGECFASAGHDGVVRVYDEATKTLTSALSSGLFATGIPGHSSRVFSVKFVPKLPHCLISGGWDNTVHVWDLRTGQSERIMFGPHIAGDAIDVHPSSSEVLTGSWRPEDAIQLWDLGSGKRKSDISWSGGPAMIYSASFSANGELIAAAGTGTNQMRLFDARTGEHQEQGSYQLPLGAGIYTCDFAPGTTKVAFAGSGSAVRELSLTS